MSSEPAVLWSRLDGQPVRMREVSELVRTEKPSTPKGGAMTKAQEVYERTEALVASGLKKADAFRQLAEEYGAEFNSIRGAYYAHTRSLGTSSGNPKRREKAVADPVEAALSVLEKALEQIDNEVGIAKSRAEDAKAEYEQARDTAGERKAAIQAKIDALKA
jgi:hypothetical protein